MPLTRSEKALVFAINIYDRLTEDNIRLDRHVRPVVVDVLSRELDIDQAESAIRLARALAQRATNKGNKK